MKNDSTELNQKLENLGYTEYTAVKQATEDLQRKYETQQQQFNHTTANNEAAINRLQEEINRLITNRNQLNQQIAEEKEKPDRQLNFSNNKLYRIKELYRRVEYSINTFLTLNQLQNLIKQ